MKTLQRTVSLFLLILLVSVNGMAQRANYTTSGGLTIGFGASASYQVSDLANSEGSAFDFIIGRQFVHREGAFLAADWKFRFLAGENRAYDHRIVPDTFSNLQYKFNNYDLELGLTLNRLRERTGIILTGFAGAGITHGRTFTDLLDADNTLYNFNSIDPNRDSKLVYKDLVSLSDGEFETELIKKAALLPTAGLYIGYQLTRAFSLGIEFKTNFYLTERNSFAGIDLDNRILTGSAPDRNSLVSLGLRWNIGGGSSPAQTVSTVNTTPVSSLPPTVNITDPSADDLHTESYNYTLRARINHVVSSDNIDFQQNGFPNNSFTYNAGTNNFIANVQLRDGENTFRIRAVNQGASAEDQVTITHDNPPPPPDRDPIPAYIPPTVNPVVTTTETKDLPVEKVYPPSVKFINPAVPVNVQVSRFPLKAEAMNVTGRGDLTLKLNGISIGNFAYRENGLVSGTLLLSEGINTIEIVARNRAGMTTERTSVTYQKPVREQTTTTYVTPVEVETTITYEEPAKERRPAPVVSITSPTSYPLTTFEAREELRATVLNVRTESEITLTINGVNTGDFSFNSKTKELRATVTLKEGQNKVIIKAQNESGSHIKDQVFIKEIKPCPPPVITLVNPSRGATSVSQESYTIKARVTNIANRSQLKTFLNGKEVYSNLSNNMVSCQVVLTSGVNIFTLDAKNDCAEDRATARITYTPSVTVTPPDEEDTPGPGDTEDPEEEACGVRINPGNSSWQFCLVTPRGTFTRENLKNTNFSYSGPATSLYFLPIGGGGKVTVKGNPYPISQGQYYLFTGRLDVTVSTSNPGAMGQWSVCVVADRAPVSGNGSKRPKSPCEQASEPGQGGKGNGKK